MEFTHLLLMILVVMATLSHLVDTKGGGGKGRKSSGRKPPAYTTRKKSDEKRKAGASGLREEFRLLKELLLEYDYAARPVMNLSEVVEVRMGVALFQIRELDEKNQFLQVNAWFQFHWTDPHLVWNASDYGGLTRLRIPSSRVWVPDIVLYNSVDETKPATEIFPETNAIVSNNGYVLWVIPAMIKSSCKIDVTFFPFDEQKCPLKFGSWTYDGFQLDLINLKPNGDLSKFIESGEWDLIGMPAKRNVEYYSCCAEPYVDVTYTIIIRRKPMFFTYNLVFPCVLLMGIGILVFCLPPESGEKVSLGVTVLLAMTVYQLLIAEAIPPTSEVVPLIGQFFGATIFLLSLSSAMTVLIMKLHFSGEHGAKVPRWLRKVVLVCLARVVRMHKTANATCKTRDYGADCASGGGDVSLLNHNHHHHHRHHHSAMKDESSCSILLNTIHHVGSTGHHNDRAGGSTSGRHSSSSAGGGFGSSPSSHQRHGLHGRHGRHHASILDPPPPALVSSHVDPCDLSDTTSVLCEVLNHVKQLNEEIHGRHTASDSDHHYKSEWRMVALVLDRILLILFFIMTVFTCVVIFVNVPY